MEILKLICIMISIVYCLQILTSLFIYYIQMKKLSTLNVVYKNEKYLKIACILIATYIISFAIFQGSIVSIVYPIITFFAFKFMKTYYKNCILENEEYLFNGVATMKKSAIEKVFIEHGGNLEKKYKVKYVGIEKYKISDYIIFKFKSDSYVLVKGYDDTYLNIMKDRYNL